MKAPFAILVCESGGFVAVKAGFFLYFFLIQWRLIPSQGRLIVLRSLEGEATAFVRHRCRLVGSLPVAADCDGVALVAPTGWWNAFPGGEHGATVDDENRCQEK